MVLLRNLTKEKEVRKINTGWDGLVEFLWLTGWSSSYLLAEQDGVTYSILVNPTQLSDHQNDPVKSLSKR